MFIICPALTSSHFRRFNPHPPPASLQLKSYAARRGCPGTPIILGGDFNSMWRKYTSDAFDQVRRGGYNTPATVHCAPIRHECHQNLGKEM